VFARTAPLSLPRDYNAPVRRQFKEGRIIRDTRYSAESFEVSANREVG
jgi:hypothetical protein